MSVIEVNQEPLLVGILRQRLKQTEEMLWAAVRSAGGEVRISAREMQTVDFSKAALVRTDDPAAGDVVLKAEIGE